MAGLFGGDRATVGNDTTNINPKAKMFTWILVLSGVGLFFPGQNP